MDDEPELPSPKLRVVVESYTDEHGRRVTVYPPAYAEGAVGQGSVRPRNHIELDDDPMD